MGGNPIKQVSQSLCADLAFDLSDGELHILAYVAVEYDGGAVLSVALPGLCTLTLLTWSHVRKIDVLFPPLLVVAGDLRESNGRQS
jgi:hypothetical protein